MGGRAHRQTGKDTRRIIVEAERQGFSTRVTKRGETRVYDPRGKFVAQAAGTTGDIRSIRNFMADMKRAGFVEDKGKGK